MSKLKYILFFIIALSLTKVGAQEENPYLNYEVPSQNLLKYNRFLINPTFSTVREDKSYINFLHRNQSVDFSDNNQNYFLSYSGRINDRTGLGLSVYQQAAGALTNYGVLANYAYGVKLNEKSNFTFGANISYYASGLDRNRVNANDPDDPFLVGERNNLLQFQPGFNLSFGKFDVGAYAENLFDYNLKTSKSLTKFNEKTYSGHLQYTHQFKKESGVLESGRLMPLARVRKVADKDITLGGSLILDLPKLGWVQGGYDNYYGASAGMGVNLNKRLSLGYTMEKGLSGELENFGLTHEISLAYAFTPNLTEDRVMLEEGNELTEQDEFLKEDEMVASTELEELKKKLAENDAIIAELMFRQDSLEQNRQKDLERRFEMVLRMVRNQTKGQRPDLEEKAKKYFINNDKDAFAENNTTDVLEQMKKKNSFKSPSLENSYVKRNSKPVVSKDASSTKTAVASNNTNRIKRRKFKNLDGVANGYYLVVNVYKGKVYMNKFIDDLSAKGVSADYVTNPNNGLKYVYLKKYSSLAEAEAAHKSKLNGKYNEAMWIMDVDNSGYSNERYASLDKLREKSKKQNIDKNPKKAIVSNDKIVAKTPKAKTMDIAGVGSGFYIIANVFANPHNANRFVKLLNSQGLNASYFINPKNNYRYVYLKKHGSWNNALSSYYSKINRSYNDKMWIMRVTPNLMT